MPGRSLMDLSAASAGGQLEQPWLVKSSTTVRRASSADASDVGIARLMIKNAVVNHFLMFLTYVEYRSLANHLCVSRAPVQEYEALYAMDGFDLTNKTENTGANAGSTDETAPRKIVEREQGKLFFYPLDGELPVIPGFETVVEIYRKKREGHAMPSRKAITFRDLRGWHSSFFLIEFGKDLAEGHMRILGETYKTLYGGELWQGMSVSEVKSPSLQDIDVYFRELLTGPFIGRYKGYLPHIGREHVFADIIDMPVVDEEGAPRYLMSFIREIQRKKPIHRVVAKK